MSRSKAVSYTHLDVYKRQDLRPSSGLVKLVDSDGDDTVDVIFVESYETYVVNTVGFQNGTIVDKYNQPMLNISTKDQPDLICNIWRDGFADDIMFLREWDVLSVAKSLSLIHIYQRVIATATLDRKDFSETGGYVIYDMNEVHAPNTTSAKRGFMIFGNRDKLLVQDELTAKSGVDVWWYAHTLADITLSEDRKQAILEIEGNKVIVTIQNGAPEQAVFRIMDAVLL